MSNGRIPAWFWWLAAALAPPLAWLWATSGHAMSTRSPLADLGWLALMALAEEWVFRGGVQEWLLRRRGLEVRRAGVSGANALASTAFVAAHLWRHTGLEALATGPISLLLGAAYESSGRRLWLPAALHLWFNVCLYAASALRTPPLS